MPLTAQQVTDLIASYGQPGAWGGYEALRRQHEQEISRGGGRRTTSALLRTLIDQARAQPIRDPRRPGGWVHPQVKADRAEPDRLREMRGGEPFTLTPADILWLQRLPTNPAEVSYDDSVSLAGLANKVQRGSGDERLIRSIWGPVKELHDRRDAQFVLDAARRPLPEFPRAPAVDAGAGRRCAAGRGARRIAAGDAGASGVGGGARAADRPRSVDRGVAAAAGRGRRPAGVGTAAASVGGAWHIRDPGVGVVRRRGVVAPERPPMWLVDMRFWFAHPGLDHLDRCRFHAEAVEQWIEQYGQRPGFDPFDDEGAFELDAAEAAIRAGERW